MKKLKKIVIPIITFILFITIGTSSFALSKTELLMSAKSEEALQPPGLEDNSTNPLDSSVQKAPNLNYAPFTDSITSISKTTARSIPGCRTYSVTLSINGTPPVEPLDIVLVIDRSGSMNKRVSSNSSRTRLDYVKGAAKNFVDKVLPQGNTLNRVSLVTYNGPSSYGEYGSDDDAAIVKPFTDSASDIKSSIDNINASYGTNTQAGFKMAKLDLDTYGRANATRVVILLSDGLASASNLDTAFDLPDNADELLPEATSEAKKIEYEKNHAYNGHSNLYIHSVAAYKAAETLFQNTKVFTIGIYLGMSIYNQRLAKDIMNLSSNSGSYVTTDPNALDSIYNEISGQLNIAAQNAQVVDTIGSNFNYVPGSAVSTYTDNNNTVYNMNLDNSNFNVTDNVITWTPGNIYKNATLTYIVQFKPSLEGGGYFPTNESAILNYEDAYGNQAPSPKVFEVPMVYVANKLRVSLTDVMSEMGTPVSLGAGGFPNGQNVMSQITGGDGNGTYVYEWRVVGASTVISTIKHPFVNPEIDTQYQLKVTDSNGCMAFATMWVRPRGSIIITKHVTGNKTDEYDPEKEFSIFIAGNNSLWGITPKDGETIRISGLKKGEYTIAEILPMFYTLVAMKDGDMPINNGKVSIGINSPVKHVTIINNRKKPSHFTDDDKALNTFKMRLLFDR